MNRFSLNIIEKNEQWDEVPVPASPVDNIDSNSVAVIEAMAM